MGNWFPLQLSILLYFISILSEVYGGCSAPPTLGHAQSDGSSTQVTYTCDVGYEFYSGETSETINCLEDDTWPSIVDCNRVQCPVLPDNAVLTVSGTVKSPEEANKYEDEVVISCSNMGIERVRGVSLGETLTVTCLANKTWDNWDGSVVDGCILIECVNPLDAHSVGDKLDTLIGSAVSFTCDTGYTFTDGSTTKSFTCNADAEWENGGKTGWSCKPRECQDLQTLGSLQYVNLEPDSHAVDDVVKVTCYEGYTFPDSSVKKTAVCFPNQTWDLVPKDCVPTMCPPVFNVSLANASTTDHWYPTIVNFTCVPPNTFPDGTKVRYSQCTKYGQWSESIPSCGEAVIIEEKYSPVSVNAKNAESFGIVALSIIGVLVGLLVVLDVLTFGMQMAFIKKNLKCLQPEVEEDDLESLDGDELMRASTISLGRGRITPAASTIDLQYPEKYTRETKSQEALQDVDVVNEELGSADIAGKKNLIPRTRLTSAKSGIQRALQTAMNLQTMKKRMTTIIKRNNFKSVALPLGADNYGIKTDTRPPSPVKVESESSESEYYTDESDED